MSEIVLNDISSGYSTGLINENFQTLEDYINLYVLNRDGVSLGQANQMEVDLDMNGNSLLNVSTDITNPDSLLTVGDGDQRYVNVTGDSMSGGLQVRLPVEDTEPARKDQLDTERNERLAGDNAIEAAYQQADANIQDQLTGETPLEASAFSEISWHGQVVENSVTIPDNKNAWSFGPVISVALGQSVTIGTDSFWTIANGEVQ